MYFHYFAFKFLKGSSKMKIQRRISLSFIVFLLLLTSAKGQEMRLITYNIKNDYQKDGENNWLSRRDAMIALFKHYNPAVFGIQEALENQVAFIENSLPGYKYFGAGRDDGKAQGEYCAVFYDTTQFELKKDSTFWLSDTPQVISKGWDAALPRICTYGLLRSKKTDQYLWVFNTHFDHIGAKARENSAKKIVEHINSINQKNYAVVIMGDLNAVPEDEPITVFRAAFDDGKEVSQKPFYGPVGTFNGFQDIVMEKRIDYFFTKGLTVLEYIHIDDRMVNNKQISDHIPVLIKVKPNQ